MPKMQAITDEMKATASRIGDRVTLLQDSQLQVRNALKNIIVHFGSTPRVLSVLHLSNVVVGYQNATESLTGYQEFLTNAADTYEWNDEQLARWADQMNEKRGVDIYSAGNTTTDTQPSDGVSAGGWDASNGWDSVGDSFPNKRPDFNSVYYTGENPEGRQRAYGKEGRHGSDSIDCCFYARARAMEVNGWTKTYGSYTTDYSTDAIKAGNRVVRFDTGNGSEMHFVFVEYYDPATDTVYFSDSNMGGSPATDGRLQAKSFNDFLNYFPNGRYVYTENP